MIESLILDSNLLLLFIVGGTSRDYIALHKRLRAYTPPDFDTLLQIVKSARRVAVTPNTLTEVSNLLRNFGELREPAQSRILYTFERMARNQEEIVIASARAVERREFRRLGLTDAALLEAAGSFHTLLTSDLDLYLAAVSRGQSAVNFNRRWNGVI